MNLLIITQAVDRNHPILGFFHRWIEEFAKHCDHVTVIGQSVGTFALPTNVTVRSLGKEAGRRRCWQILHFWRLLWTERSSYDVVFVHMTPIWVVLGWPMWAMLHRPIALWYEIRRGGWMLRCACWMSRWIFSASSHGLPTQVKNQHIVGHGIDTQLFHPADVRDPHLIVTTGRITPIKHTPEIVEALAILGEPYRLRIIGDAFIGSDQDELHRTEETIDRHHLRNRITWGFTSQEEAAAILGRANLFLHASGGGLDKALLEAMACGCLVVSSSSATVGVLPDSCRTATHELGARASALLTLAKIEQEALRRDLRCSIERNHNLAQMMNRLLSIMAQNTSDTSSVAGDQ